MPMQKISTCGNNPSIFSYDGDVRHGVVIQHTHVTYNVSHNIFNDLLNHFAGKAVHGGFSMTQPTLGHFE